MSKFKVCVKEINDTHKRIAVVPLAEWNDVKHNYAKFNISTVEDLDQEFKNNWPSFAAKFINVHDPNDAIFLF